MCIKERGGSIVFLSMIEPVKKFFSTGWGKKYPDRSANFFWQTSYEYCVWEEGIVTLGI